MSTENQNVEFENWKPKFGLFEMIKLDWAANPENMKGKMVTTLFRVASWLRRGGVVLRVLGIPYLIFYRVWVEWILGIELPPLTRVGPGLAIFHGQGIVVNNRSIIGANCILRQGVTIGNRRDDDLYGCPVIGNNVVVATNALVLGRLTIGDKAVIGAGAVVIKDVKEGSVMVATLATELERSR